MTNRYYFDEIDWDYFGDSSESPFSGLHFHPGRYISQIPAAIIGALSSPGDTILDPFCGSGTSLVEAQRLGRFGIGIDLNPVSTMMCRAKLLVNRSARITKILHFHASKLVNLQMHKASHASTNSIAPNAVQLTKWYHEETAYQLTLLWNYIQDTSGYSKYLLSFCFSGILLAVCSERRHWGYICDNTNPLEKRYFDAFEAMNKSIYALSDAYHLRDRGLPPEIKFPLKPSTIYEGSAADVIHSLQKPVDLIITSPPYYGVIDYVKAQRLSMEWLGHPISSLRSLETGARSKRHRKNAYTEYIEDLNKTFSAAYSVLKPKSYMVIVLGESTHRAPVVSDFISRIQAIGFSLCKKELRSISTGRAQAPGIKNEFVLVFEKLAMQ